MSSPTVSPSGRPSSLPQPSSRTICRPCTQSYTDHCPSPSPASWPWRSRNLPPATTSPTSHHLSRPAISHRLFRHQNLCHVVDVVSGDETDRRSTLDHCGWCGGMVDRGCNVRSSPRTSSTTSSAYSSRCGSCTTRGRCTCRWSGWSAERWSTQRASGLADAWTG